MYLHGNALVLMCVIWFALVALMIGTFIVAIPTRLNQLMTVSPTGDNALILLALGEAAFITFSAYDDDGTTVVQVQPLLRASDPIYDIGMRIGYADKIEDEFWQATLINIAKHFGVQGQVTQQVACIDPRWQWKYAGNIWNNAAIRTALDTPVRLVKRLLAAKNWRQNCAHP